jgi:hypothetical protein
MADSWKTLGAAETGDIMDLLLSAKNHDLHATASKLDDMLYRDPASAPATAMAGNSIDRLWTPDKDQVAVEVSGSHANIRISIADAEHKPVTMHELADVAVKAIVNELRRD